MARIALYGGSFDPPHLGHVLTATYALCAGKVDEVRLIPSYRHPFGKTMSPFEVRCEMTREAVAHLGPRVIVDTIESEREAVSYTIDTLRALRERHPDAAFLWVGGADTWRQRHTWREWQALEALVTPYIFGREGVAPPDDVEIQTTLPEISSTSIREAIRRGAPVEHLLSAPVMALIQAHGLYR